MASERPDADWVYDLRRHPKLAEKIGVFTAEFAALEYTLWKLYGLALGGNEKDAMLLLGTLQSFSIKLSAMERFVAHRLRADKAEPFLEIFAESKTINKFRNRLAHGLYMTDDSRSVVLIDYDLSDPTKKKSGSFELSEQLLDSEIANLRATRAKMFKIFAAHGETRTKHGAEGTAE